MRDWLASPGFTLAGAVTAAIVALALACKIGGVW